jgi:hypothetical protein
MCMRIPEAWGVMGVATDVTLIVDSVTLSGAKGPKLGHGPLRCAQGDTGGRPSFFGAR